MLFFGLAFFMAYCVSVYIVLCYIFAGFRSIENLARAKTGTVHLIDFIALFFQFTVGFSFLKWFVFDTASDMRSQAAIAFIVLTFCCVGSFYGVAILRYASVASWQKRLTFLSIVLPVGISVAFLALPILFQSNSISHLLLRLGSLFALAYSARSIAVWVQEPPQRD